MWMVDLQKSQPSETLQAPVFSLSMDLSRWAQDILEIRSFPKWRSINWNDG